MMSHDFADAVPRPELLTKDERILMTLLADVWDLFGKIAGVDTTDLNEVGDKVHQLQNTVLAQAAARAYPDEYRLLGKKL